jgi:hypothetical protein
VAARPEDGQRVAVKLRQFLQTFAVSVVPVAKIPT